MSEILRLYVPVFKPPDQRAAVCILMKRLPFFAAQVSGAAIDQVVAMLADYGAQVINSLEAHTFAGCLLIGVCEAEKASWHCAVTGETPWGFEC